MPTYAISIVMMALFLASRAIAFAPTDFGHDARWLALLHYQNGKSLITDQTYFLSPYGQHDPVAELNATMRAFEGSESGQAAAQCRFPARLKWVKEIFPEQTKSFPAVPCPELDEFYQKVPADEVSLAFASEYIPDPTTMMGHLFMKIDGKSSQGRATHSLSFFADLTKVKSTTAFIVGSLFTGTDGIYILEPYRDKMNSYLKEGQRNVWEFPLKLSPSQRETLLAHIWEMKGINVAYDFKDNNCASSIVSLLNVADPTFQQALYKKFITPADLLKRLNQDHRLEPGRFTASDIYAIRQFEKHLSSQQISTIRAADLKLDYTELKLTISTSPYVQHTVETLVDYHHAKGDLNDEQLIAIKTQLPNLTADPLLGDQALVPTPAYNILSKPNATSVRANYVAGSHGDYLKLGIAPAYNPLMSANAYAEQEYEVRLFALDIGLSDKKANIQKFDLISFKSFLPEAQLAPSLSRSLEIGFENQGFGMETSALYPKVFGGVGSTFNIQEHGLYPFLMLNGGYSYYRSNNVLSFAPEAGLIAREEGFGKSYLSASKYFNSADYKYQNKLSFKQSFFIKDGLDLNLEFNHARNDRAEINNEIQAGITLAF